jgi:ATP-dependent protease ClpP protease subunit
MFKNVLLTLFLIKSDSFSLNRRSILGGIVGMNIINNKNSNKDNIEIPNNNNFLYNKKDNNDNNEINTEYGIIQELNNDIYFYGPVSQRSCFELKNKINELDVKSSLMQIQLHIDPPPIHLHIQSNGGSLFHSLYIIDLIKSINTPVYTYIDGFAASAATLISVVGKKRYITKNSLMLIHQLSGSDSGKYDELEEQLTNMKVLMTIIRNIYLNNTNINPVLLNNLLKKDLWLDSKTCLTYGLVDEII